MDPSQGQELELEPEPVRADLMRINPTYRIVSIQRVDRLGDEFFSERRRKKTTRLRVRLHLTMAEIQER